MIALGLIVGFIVMACLRATPSNPVPVQTATPVVPTPDPSSGGTASIWAGVSGTEDQGSAGAVTAPYVLEAPFVDPGVPTPPPSEDPIIKPSTFWAGGTVENTNPDLPQKTDNPRIVPPSNPDVPTPTPWPSDPPPLVVAGWGSLVGYWQTPSGDVRKFLDDGTVRIVYNPFTSYESLSGPWVTFDHIDNRSDGEWFYMRDGAGYLFVVWGPTSIYWPQFGNGEQWTKLIGRAVASPMPDYQYPTPTPVTDPILFPDFNPLIGDAAPPVPDPVLLPAQDNPDVVENWQNGSDCPPDTFVLSPPVWIGDAYLAPGEPEAPPEAPSQEDGGQMADDTYMEFA